MNKDHKPLVIQYDERCILILMLSPLKCWNLECIIDAKQQGKDAPSELRLEDLLNEETGREGDKEVTFIN